MALDYADRRKGMVRVQLSGRDIHDPKVLKAMETVPRHLFVPEERKNEAYDDHPLPIGSGQTISQPYIVAFMTQAAKVSSSDRVLEIGTGCGYQAAVLGELCKEVYTLEIIETLGHSATDRLEKLGYKNVHIKVSDGYEGWRDQAPFDAVVVTAVASHVPQPLKDQLKIRGRLIIPVQGDAFQELVAITKTKTGFEEAKLLSVSFVPMTGKIKSDFF